MAIKWKSLSSEPDLDEIAGSPRLDMHASRGPVLRGQRQAIGGGKASSGHDTDAYHDRGAFSKCLCSATNRGVGSPASARCQVVQAKRVNNFMMGSASRGPVDPVRGLALSTTKDLET